MRCEREFNSALPSPGSDPGDGVQHQICLNAEWTEYVIGALLQYQNACVWQAYGDNLAAIEAQIFTACDALASTEECMPPFVIGEIKIFTSFQFPPGAWFDCHGQSLARDDYPELFNVIQDIYGAADGDHFNLPNLHARFPLGYNDSIGEPMHDVGESSGAEQITLSVGQLPAHHHDAGSLKADIRNAAGSNTTRAMSALGDTLFHTGGITGNTGDTGSGDEIDVQPRHLALIYIIYAGPEYA
jgi:microcystin-dependent protein